MKATIIGIIITAVFSLQSNFDKLRPDGNEQETQFSYTVKGNASEKTLIINDLYSDLDIIGGTSSEIKIVAYKYKGLPEKAKGLKPLGGSGVENTGIGLSFNPDGNKIALSGVHRAADDAKYIIYMPKDMKLKIEDQGWKGGDISIKGLTNEVEAKTQVGDLSFEDVSGPIVAHTLSSDLKIEFTSLNQISPSSISSVSGDLEITIPSTIKGTFKMYSTSGGVYTDIDFDLGEEAGTKRIVGHSAKGKLNGGGVEVSLRSISGDIYIRKAN